MPFWNQPTIPEGIAPSKFEKCAKGHRQPNPDPRPAGKGVLAYCLECDGILCRLCGGMILAGGIPLEGPNSDAELALWAWGTHYGEKICERRRSVRAIAIETLQLKVE